MTSVTVSGNVIQVGRGKFGLEIIVETKGDGQYANPVMVEVGQKNPNFHRWEMIKEGDVIVASGDIRGREHAGKFYTNVSGYKFESAGNGQKAPF